MSRVKTVIGDDHGNAFSGKALADILAIGLVTPNEAAAGDEYHDRVRRFDRVHGLINVQAVAGIVAVRDIAADLDAVAALLFEEGLVQRLREMQIEHGTARDLHFAQSLYKP